MDVLSEVLRAVRLTGAVFFDVTARAPWVAENPPLASICARVMPDFERVIAFHILLDGECWAQLGDDSQPPIRLGRGDALLLPQGDGHRLGSEAGRRSKPDYGLYYRPADRPLPFW